MLYPEGALIVMLVLAVFAGALAGFTLGLLMAG